MSAQPDPPWTYICLRCRGRVTENPSTGKWEHAEIADLVFCDMVMRAPERVAAREKGQEDGN